MSNIYKTQFNAWSCEFSIELIESNCEPQKIVSEIQQTLQQYEQTFSRFKDDSILARLNQGETVERNELFDTVLAVATNLSEQLSTAYFNPHVNLRAHGYHQSFEKKRFQLSQAVQESLPQFPQGIEIQAQNMRLKPGSSIDFGAFLKGYLAEQFAEQYKHCCRGIIINFGGDLCVRGKDVHSNYFQIGIFNPITRQDEVILLKNQSLSTSGTYKRNWSIKGDTKHHILDPSTNTNPTSEFVSISFRGQDGALCDALSTAAFSAPPTVWDEWKAKFPSIEYLAIKKSGGIHTSTASKS